MTAARVARGLSVVALLTAFIVGWSAPAMAEVDGSCDALIKGISAKDRSSTDPDQAIDVEADEVVPYSVAASAGVTKRRFLMEYAGIRIEVDSGTSKGDSDFSAGAAAVDDYAWLGSGLYKVIGEATLKDGSTCSGAVLVNVKGNPLTTVAGIVGLILVAVGGIGAVAASGGGSGSVIDELVDFLTGPDAPTDVPTDATAVGATAAGAGAGTAAGHESGPPGSDTGAGTGTGTETETGTGTEDPGTGVPPQRTEPPVAEDPTAAGAGGAAGGAGTTAGGAAHGAPPGAEDPTAAGTTAADPTAGDAAAAAAGAAAAAAASAKGDPAEAEESKPPPLPGMGLVTGTGEKADALIKAHEQLTEAIDELPLSDEQKEKLTETLGLEKIKENLDQVKEVTDTVTHFEEVGTETVDTLNRWGVPPRMVEAILWFRWTTEASGRATQKFTDGIVTPVLEPVTKALGEAGVEADAEEIAHAILPVQEFAEEASKASMNAVKNVLGGQQRIDQIAEGALDEEELAIVRPRW